MGRGATGVMADGHKEGKKSCPALRDLRGEKVGQDPYPPHLAQHHFRAQNVTGVERDHIWGREIRKASPLVGLDGGEMIDKVQCAYLFYDLVSRSNDKPEILFHLQSWD